MDHFGTLALALLPFSGMRALVWQTQTADSRHIGAYTNSIAVDSQGRPRICYGNLDEHLWFAIWNGTSWDLQAVDPGTSTGMGGNSLQLDANDRPRIAYYRYGPTAGTTGLRYVAWNGTTWENEGVRGTTGGEDTSLALDQWDCPHMSYWTTLGGKRVLGHAACHSLLAVRWPR